MERETVIWFGDYGYIMYPDNTKGGQDEISFVKELFFQGVMGNVTRPYSAAEYFQLSEAEVAQAKQQSEKEYELCRMREKESMKMNKTKVYVVEEGNRWYFTFDENEATRMVTLDDLNSDEDNNVFEFPVQTQEGVAVYDYELNEYKLKH